MGPLVAVCRRVFFIIHQTIFKNTNSRKTVDVCGALRASEIAECILDAVCHCPVYSKCHVSPCVF